MISVNFWPNFIALVSLGYYAGLDSRRRVRRPRRSQWHALAGRTKSRKGITSIRRLIWQSGKFGHTHLVRNEPRNSNYTRNETSSTQITLQKITRISVLITCSLPRLVQRGDTNTTAVRSHHVHYIIPMSLIPPTPSPRWAPCRPDPASTPSPGPPRRLSRRYLRGDASRQPPLTPRRSPP